MKRALTGAAVTVVVGAGVAWVLNFEGVLHFGKFHPFQVTGDPPITVSDGSLHVKSDKGWTSDPTASAAVLTAMPPDGQLVAGKDCGLKDGNGKYVAASLWTDDDNDKPYTIKAGATIVIHHDSNDANDAGKDSVTILLPKAQGPLTITSAEGEFAAEDINPKDNMPYAKGKHNRRHARPGNITSIEITQPDGTSPKPWPPPDYPSKNPHFTLSFCYSK